MSGFANIDQRLKKYASLSELEEVAERLEKYALIEQFTGMEGRIKPLVVACEFKLNEYRVDNFTM